MNKLPIYKIFVEDAGNYLQIALVDEPAIEEDFLKFKNEPSKLIFESEKKIISGPVMIPDQLIYRNDQFGERYVYYDVETVAKAATLFLKNGMKFNEMHTEIDIKDIDVIESYLTKANNEFDIPEGSWVITAKIKDDNLWERVKSGEFNGFSIQSIFSNELESNFTKTKELNMKEEIRTKILNAVNTILFGDEPVVEPVVAPVVEPVVEPVIEPVVEPVVEVKLTEDMVTKMIIDAQAETITKLEKMINDLSEKVEKYGNTPIVEPVKKDIVDNVKTYENPATKFFPKK